MFCPKCKAKIGLLRYESRTQNHVAQGMACCICGFWVERGGGAAKKAASSKKSRRR